MLLDSEPRLRDQVITQLRMPIGFLIGYAGLRAAQAIIETSITSSARELAAHFLQRKSSDLLAYPALQLARANCVDRAKAFKARVIAQHRSSTHLRQCFRGHRLIV
jgi:hypothetical protein